MTLIEALSRLAATHTRKDALSGFVVNIGARPEFWDDREKYIEAWKVVRAYLKLQVEPPHGSP